MALKRVWIASPNFSSRGGATPRLLVLHTAEGARTIESLGSYFQGNVSASSHAGADDKVNTIGEYVKRDKKAWTCSNYNGVSMNIEMCGFASWSTETWHAHPNMLDNCAKWIAEEAAHFGIPIVKLNASQAQGSGRGVCQHVDLGAGGGGHHDCGSGFPMNEVLTMAHGAPPPSPSPAPASDWSLTGDVVVPNPDGRLEVFEIRGRSVIHRYQSKPGGAWHSGWESLGEPGGDLLQLSVIPNKDGRLEVFTLAGDGRVKNRYQDKPGGAWHSGWGDLGVINTGQDITTARHADGRVGIWVRAANMDVWTREQRDPGSGWDNWYSLGGSS